MATTSLVHAVLGARRESATQSRQQLLPLSPQFDAVAKGTDGAVLAE